MPLMKEAVTKDNFDRMEKGLRPVKPKQEARPEPKPLELEDEIILKSIPSAGYDVKLEEAHKEIAKNEDGVRFVIFRVVITLNPITKEKPKTITGWMYEGEFLAFVRTYRKQIDQQVIRW